MSQLRLYIMRRASLKIIRLAIGLFLLLSGCSSSQKRSSTDTTSFTDTTTNPAAPGKDLPLPARWWDWEESSPVDANPIDDPTGAACAQNQPSDVWFLAGTHGGNAHRTCTVPSGPKIFFPVLNAICLPRPGASAEAAIASCSATPTV